MLFFPINSYDSMPSDEVIGRELNDILTSPEFAERKNILFELIERLIEWIADTLNWELTSAQLEIGSWIVLTIISAAAVAVILIVILRIKRRGLLLSGSRKSQPPTAMADALALCDRAVADGDFSAASVWLFMSFLRFLRDEGYISNDESRTNRQYIDEARRTGCPFIELFSAYAALFSQVRYGGYKPSREEFDDWNQALSFLRGEVAA